MTTFSALYAVVVALFDILASPPDPAAWAPYVGAAATTFSVIVSASLALIVASRQLRVARSIARMRATLDLIEKSESSEHYQKITLVFSKLRRHDAFMALVNPDERDRPSRLALLAYLNHYETIALFIQRGVLDEATYREWIIGALIRDWNAASAFIQRERWDWNAKTRQWVSDPDLLAKFQWLARRWSAEAVDLNANYSPPPSKASPDDTPLPQVNAHNDPATVPVDNANR